jgi:hypothetical protein
MVDLLPLIAEKTIDEFEQVNVRAINLACT